MRRSLVIPWLAALIAVPPAGAYSGVISTCNSNCTSTPYYFPLRGQHPALVELDVRFLSGDKNVRTMRAFPRRPHWGNFLDPALVTLLADQNAGDPWSISASWIDRRQYTLRSTTGNCSGTCLLPIPALPAGDSIALAGIDLEFTDGSDHFLQEIAVVPDPQRGFISVTFTDASRSRPFRATIYYLRLVALEIAAVEVRSGHRSSGVPGGLRTAGEALLRGFRLAFTNGDHRLSRWSVSLCSEHVDSSCVRDDAWSVTLADQNGDDPYDWWLSYTRLRE